MATTSDAAGECPVGETAVLARVTARIIDVFREE
jgi:hypothetical protein